MKDGLILPSVHQLQAAWFAAQLIGDTPVERRRLYESLPHVPTEGLYSNGDLEYGLELLCEIGALESRNGLLQECDHLEPLKSSSEDEGVRLLLALFLEEARPSWLPIVVSNRGVLREYIPDHALNTLEEAFVDLSQLNAFLRDIGEKSRRSRELGEAGEKKVIRECKRQRHSAGYPKLAEKVVQASSISDSFGYDIVAPRQNETSYHLEVKTDGNSGPDIRFYLSRDQFEIGREDPGWRLVLCQRVIEESTAGEIQIAGWCNLSQIESQFPKDTESGSICDTQWKEVRVHLHRQALNPGVPPL